MIKTIINFFRRSTKAKACDTAIRYIAAGNDRMEFRKWAAANGDAPMLVRDMKAVMQAIPDGTVLSIPLQPAPDYEGKKLVELGIIDDPGSDAKLIGFEDQIWRFSKSDALKLVDTSGWKLDKTLMPGRQEVVFSDGASAGIV